jgi:hypothetical protein
VGARRRHRQRIGEHLPVRADANEAENHGPREPDGLRAVQKIFPPFTRRSVNR